MKKVLVLLAIAGGAVLYSCGGGEQKPIPGTEPKDASNSAQANDKRGVGKFTHVDVSPTLDAKLAEEGEGIAKTKCLSCHKVTEEKLVGPGWKGVTQRRKPEWIMNFVTNTDEMLNKDPQAMAALEICLVRMPNQNLSDVDARKVLEFMRKNDGVK